MSLRRKLVGIGTTGLAEPLRAVSQGSFRESPVQLRELRQSTKAFEDAARDATQFQNQSSTGWPSSRRTSRSPRPIALNARLRSSKLSVKCAQPSVWIARIRASAKACAVSSAVVRVHGEIKWTARARGASEDHDELRMEAARDFGNAVVKKRYRQSDRSYRPVPRSRGRSRQRHQRSARSQLDRGVLASR